MLVYFKTEIICISINNIKRNSNFIQIMNKCNCKNKNIKITQTVHVIVNHTNVSISRYSVPTYTVILLNHIYKIHTYIIRKVYSHVCAYKYSPKSTESIQV